MLKSKLKAIFRGASFCGLMAVLASAPTEASDKHRAGNRWVRPCTSCGEVVTSQITGALMPGCGAIQAMPRVSHMSFYNVDDSICTDDEVVISKTDKEVIDCDVVGSAYLGICEPEQPEISIGEALVPGAIAVGGGGGGFGFGSGHGVGFARASSGGFGAGFGGGIGRGNGLRAAGLLAALSSLVGRACFSPHSQPHCFPVMI